jgi:prepilin-type N-terminal cleavage/methylation domain-containing protein
MQPHLRHRCFECRAFTLIELLVVMSVIAVLLGMMFPIYGKVQESARRVQAKNDVVQLASAVNAYYTEYGKYPIAPPGEGQPATEVTFLTNNADLLNVLRAIDAGVNVGDALNPRRIAFIQVPDVKDQSRPRSGIYNGNWYDPWGPQAGKPESGIYHVRIDGSYSGHVTDPYPGYGGEQWGPPPVINQGVIAWSVATTGETTYELRDQVLSYQ